MSSKISVGARRLHWVYQHVLLFYGLSYWSMQDLCGFYLLNNNFLKSKMLFSLMKGNLIILHIYNRMEFDFKALRTLAVCYCSVVCGGAFHNAQCIEENTPFKSSTSPGAQHVGNLLCIQHQEAAAEQSWVWCTLTERSADILFIWGFIFFW